MSPRAAGQGSHPGFGAAFAVEALPDRFLHGAERAHRGGSPAREAQDFVTRVRLDGSLHLPGCLEEEGGIHDGARQARILDDETQVTARRPSGRVLELLDARLANPRSSAGASARACVARRSASLASETRM